MRKFRICLDAGHYGKYNQSPAVPEYYESDMNWKLHLLLKKYLEQYGVEVSQTRSNKDTDLEVTARCMKAKGCDLLISVHSNAVGNGVNESVDYPVVCVPINGKGDKIGQALADCVESVMQTKENGRIYKRQGNNGDYYGVIRGATAVGVVGLIVEHSFHTNTRSTNWLLDESNLDKLAQAEAKVIADYYGLKKQENPSGAYAVGDVVDFLGGRHYVSAWSKDGVERKAGKAKITAVAMEGMHPYHLIAEQGGGSDVYGWVDSDAIRAEGQNEQIALCDVRLPQLSKGAEGQSVRALQLLLIGNGYTCGNYGADGDFGGATEMALRNYQGDNGLDADGICGIASWNRLLKGS